MDDVANTLTQLKEKQTKKSQTVCGPPTDHIDVRLVHLAQLVQAKRPACQQLDRAFSVARKPNPPRKNWRLMS
eukprot:4199426-Amphidinium_carterae.1